jgi:deoxyribonuclease V
MEARADLLHAWDVSPGEAIAIQQQLRGLIRQEWDPMSAEVRRVAGIDVGIKKGVARAAVVVLTYPELAPLDVALAEQAVSFPYVPGLLTFREGRVVLAALARLQVEPDLLIFDGQGVAHPRRLGIAAHIGVLVDRPSIGCAKSRLWGKHQEPGSEKGDYTLLRDPSMLLRTGGQEIIGAVVRTRTKVKPVYVSVGHRIDLAGAIGYVLGCCTRFRLPETTRLAHRAAAGEKLQLSLLPRGGKM